MPTLINLTPHPIRLRVSLICAQVAQRFDVLSPGTGPSDDPVRDAAGRIYAVTRLIAHV